jgi:hypothetical protein
MSRRLQITLSEDQYALLHEASVHTGRSMADFIRNAVDIVYRPHRQPRVRGYEVVVALKKGIDRAVQGQELRTRGRGMQFGSRRGRVDDP